MERSASEQMLSELQNNLEAILHEVIPANYPSIGPVLRKFRKNNLKPWVIVSTSSDARQSASRILGTHDPHKHVLHNIYLLMRQHEMWAGAIIGLQLKLSKVGTPAFVVLEIEYRPTDSDNSQRRKTPETKAAEWRRRRFTQSGYMKEINHPNMADYIILRANGIKVPSPHEMTASDRRFLKKKGITLDDNPDQKS